MPDDTRSSRPPPAHTSGDPASPALPALPPRGGLLDRLARWLEGGGEGEPADGVVDLSGVLDAGELAKLPRRVATFFAAPHRFDVAAGLDGDAWSRALLAASAVVFRQTDIPDRERGFEAYPVGQVIYRDRRGRVHWDRYGLVDGAWRRLFVARVAGAPGRFVETFVLYGVPVALVFAPRVEDGALVFTLTRRWTSPLSWIARVEYRTGLHAPDEVRTHGDFRVPLLRFRVRTEFRARFAER
jgi:hypothetical protein